MLREHWSLEEIQALPLGEQDYFDRKSGRLLDDSGFRHDLAKAFSAFANSGGGHILIGIEDDGTLTGAPICKKGRTTTREWLEQLIPGLIEPVPTAFRLHSVSTSVETPLPEGKTILVIDIADSSHAPFQSRVDKKYYYRVGSHSVAAPHYYLEALRNRKIAPSLDADLADVRLSRMKQVGDDVFIQYVVHFKITNVGNITPSLWHIDLRYGNQRIGSSKPFCRNGFPPLTLKYGDTERIHNTPVLPSQSRVIADLLGLYVPGNLNDPAGVAQAVAHAFADCNRLQASVTTESHTGSWRALDSTLFLESTTAGALELLAADTGDARRSRKLGGGLEIVRFGVEDYKRSSDHVTFGGAIRNGSNSIYKKLHLFTSFHDSDGAILGFQDTEIGSLPPNCTRPWSDWIRADEIWEFSEVQIYFYDRAWVDAPV